MAQITSGIRSVLSTPWVYDSLQNILGATRVRRDLVNEFIRPTEKDRILDIGCGTAEILAFLPSTITYCGYDISESYIDSAKKRYGNRGEFHCNYFDIEAVRKNPAFDTVLMLGALHHMDDEVAETLISLAFKALGEKGRLITLDPCYTASQSPFARFLISRDRGQNVRTPEGYETLAQSVFPNTRGTIRNKTRIPYTHWIMECSK